MKSINENNNNNNNNNTVNDQEKISKEKEKSIYLLIIGVLVTISYAFITIRSVYNLLQLIIARCFNGDTIYIYIINDFNNVFLFYLK